MGNKKDPEWSSSGGFVSGDQLEWFLSSDITFVVSRQGVCLHGTVSCTPIDFMVCFGLTILQDHELIRTQESATFPVQYEIDLDHGHKS